MRGYLPVPTISRAYVSEKPSVHRETPTTRRLVVEVMPLVLDDEAQVGVAGKVDGQLDLGNRGHVDDIRWVASEGTVAIRVVGWHTRQPLVQGEVDTSRGIDSVQCVS
jgi:hypothetical protein